MPSYELKDIQDWLGPRIEAITDKIEDLKQTVERTDEHRSDQIKQLYEENKVIRESIGRQEIALRGEITSAASANRGLISDHETRLKIVEERHSNSTQGKVNWIQIVLILVSVAGIVVSTFVAITLAHIGGK